VEPTRTFTRIDPQDRDAVLWLQLALAKLMPGPAIMVHIGQLGPMTEKALRLYQLEHKLPLTGQPDQLTLEHIQRALESQS
jgi:hypothetical protein